jgi:RNA polymerase sigma-70 factor (ECF subfamily)
MACMAATTRTPALEHELESHRRELTGYCYRMLGSGFEAEDAVQETFVRAWRNYASFEGRSSLRSWLYRIATNVCLDMLQGPQRRARPMDMGPSSSAETVLGAPLVESTWVMPIADSAALPEEGDPAELAAQRETLRLAFVAALQHLPPRQRAVLILREVLRWQASEVAELLGMTVASVNSALQRARATVDQLELDTSGPADLTGDEQDLLTKYVDYFERYDIDSLVSLIAEDAEFSMPPFDLWLRGTPDIAKWYVGQGAGCEDSRMIATRANGCAAFAQYKPAGANRWEPWALQVIEVSDGKISGLHHWIPPFAGQLFDAFGLPPILEGEVPYSSERANSSS